MCVTQRKWRQLCDNGNKYGHKYSIQTAEDDQRKAIDKEQDTEAIISARYATMAPNTH